jgi:transposase
MVSRFQEQGDPGSLARLKASVHLVRPRKAGQSPIQRDDTKPGEHMHDEWGACHDEKDGHEKKLSGFMAVRGSSRLRFIPFVKRCDTPPMIRCMMEACASVDGRPQAALTDRMKGVFLDRDGNTPVWNPICAECAASVGIATRVCKPYRPQTRGNGERSVGIITDGFWPGVRCTESDDLNEQARKWCDRLTHTVHRTTLCVPLDRWVEKHLRPLPSDSEWDRFGAEGRRVSWDGFMSSDGVLDGLPAEPPVAGTVVLVRERHQDLHVFAQGTLITTLSRRPRSQEMSIHPEQRSHITPTSPIRALEKPLGYHVTPPQVETRPLVE